MSFDRRAIVWGGGVLAAAIPLGIAPAWAGDVVEIAMDGRKDGSKVWFEPIGVWVRPGQTVRWTNRDPGNSHTATAYHPANFDHPLRIPSSADPWDSDFLFPGESFSVTFDRQGVYDYFCIPHEHAGMVGRLVVGDQSAQDWIGKIAADRGVPEAALKAFPSVDAIVRDGKVRHG